MQWLNTEGSKVAPGDEVAEVETEKILAAVEVRDAGVLRRQIAKPGEVLPVGALLAVVADESISDAEIESYIADFQANFVSEPEDESAEDQGPQTVEVEGRRLRFLKRGDSGDPLVLIHGFGGGLNNWLFNLETLARFILFADDKTDRRIARDYYRTDAESKRPSTESTD